MQTSEIFSHLLVYILIVNIITLIWAIKSWKKTIREKWMNNLRDSASNIIGSAEHIYLIKNFRSLHGDSNLTTAISDFIEKEQKLLLLFENGSDTFENIKVMTEELRKSAEEGTDYRENQEKFRLFISERLSKEWKVVNHLFK